IRGRNSCLRCAKSCRDLHTNQSSSLTGHHLYRHHYHGGPGSLGRSTGNCQSMDLHHICHGMSAAHSVWTPGCGAGILAGQAITSTGLSTVSGDLDISPLSSITGFPPGTYTGTEHIDDTTAVNAQAQLTTAYVAASTLPQGASLKPDIGGETLYPGVYTTVAQPSLGITGNLTLDPLGDPNAVWVFQISSTLTTAGGIVT